MEREARRELDAVRKEMWERPNGSCQVSFTKVFDDFEAKVDHEKRKIEAEYQRDMVAQLELARWVSRITPASSCRFALSTLNEAG